MAQMSYDRPDEMCFPEGCVLRLLNTCGVWAVRANSRQWHEELGGFKEMVWVNTKSGRWLQRSDVFSCEMCMLVDELENISYIVTHTNNQHPNDLFTPCMSCVQKKASWLLVRVPASRQTLDISVQCSSHNLSEHSFHLVKSKTMKCFLISLNTTLILQGAAYPWSINKDSLTNYIFFLKKLNWTRCETFLDTQNVLNWGREFLPNYCLHLDLYFVMKLIVIKLC